MKLSAVFLLVYFTLLWSHSSAKNIVKRKSIGYGTDAVPPIRKPSVVDGKYPKLQNQAQATISRKDMDRLNRLIMELKASQAGAQATDPITSTVPTKPPTPNPAYRDSVGRIQAMLKNIQSKLNGMKLAQPTSAGIQKGQDRTGQLGHPSEKIGVTNKPASRTTQTSTTRSTPGTPTSGPYLGFSPTTPATTLVASDIHPGSDQEPLKDNPSHAVGSRQVPEHNPLYPALKQYIAQSFINAFDILKTALVKIDKDVEQGFKQLYNLETDHYNAANGDINANGDKIDRLQKYVSDELNVIKKEIKDRPVVDQSALNRSTQGALDNLLNMTNTILNITRTINDRTERITEIKEKELQMAMLNKGQRPPHGPGSSQKHRRPNKHKQARPNKQNPSKQTPSNGILQQALNNGGPPQTGPGKVVAKGAMSPPAGVMNKPVVVAPLTGNKAMSSPATTKREMDRTRLGRTLISENDDDFNTDIIKLLEDYVDEQ